MRYEIKREIPGRIRFDLLGKIPEHDAVALEELFYAKHYVTKTITYPKVGHFTVCYDAPKEEMDSVRQKILNQMASLSLEKVKSWEATDSLALAPRPRHLFAKLAWMAINHYARRMFLPAPLGTIMRFIHALPFWKLAWRSLRRGRVDVPVLDGAAIAMGFLQNGTTAAGSSMFLLNVGETLENYTQRRSESSLVQSLLDIPASARLLTNETEIETPISKLKEGDIVVARLGDAVPVDGKVISGQAAVNQASLTGESVAVIRKEGDSVYAGTAIEEGEIKIIVTGNPQDSKVRSIVSIVEQSERLKSSEQKRAESLADKIVPWNFLLAGIVALTTRNLAKTSAALMVDYSCALKLSGSIAVMAAQKESAQRGFTVKGSKYFDHMAEADTIVFDKTGTLTQAAPAVTQVESYGHWSKKEVLRFAACLEEHFPHPVARAVVNAAADLGLKHREEHAEVEYIVAHGIASSLNGKRCVIGSEHFVIEDENVAITQEQLDYIHNNANGNSPLFLALDGKLEGVIYIEDPLKANVASVIEALREEGFKRVIMLTGDNEVSAARIAAEAGITEYEAEMLPEDKLAYIKKLQKQGCRVAMVGDGVNDSPALSVAHVSIAMSSASAIAREAADIALVSSDLCALVELRQVSRILQKRMKQGYYFAIGFNSLLMALGISGAITPQLSNMLHNGSTIALSAYNARAYLTPSTQHKMLQAETKPALLLGTNSDIETNDETEDKTKIESEAKAERKEKLKDKTRAETTIEVEAEIEGKAKNIKKKSSKKKKKKNSKKKSAKK